MPFKKPDATQTHYARKVRLAVDEATAGYLDGQSKICNWLWNKLKDEVDTRMAALSAAGCSDFRSETQTKRLLNDVYSEIGLRNLVPGLKEKHPFLRCVHSSPLKNIALRMARAIKVHRTFRNKSRTGPAAGWITYKGWARGWMSLEYDEPGKGWGVMQGGLLDLRFGVDREGQRLSGRARLIAPPKGLTKARTCRIVREGRDRYFAVFTFRRTRLKEKANWKADTPQRAVYLDPNHKNFAYGLDREGRAFEIANLNALKPAERTLDALKSKRDRCNRKSLWVDTVRADASVSTHWRPSRRWHAIDAAITRLESKVRDQKKHFQYALANRLCRDYDLIGVGDYVPASTDHGKGQIYNRAVNNRTFHGSFKAILAVVGVRSGKRVVVTDEKGTTRTCHLCQHVMPQGIHPAIRQWTCPGCKAGHHRDENACQNGLRRLLEHSGADAGNLPLPCSGPVQIDARCDWRFQPQGWQEIPKGGANVNSTHPSEHRRRLVGKSARTRRGDDHASAPAPTVLSIHA
jgi:putative transposase